MNRLLILAAAFIFFGYQSAYAMEMKKLLEKMAAMPVKYAQFKETRNAYFLDQPLVSEGSLEFKSPGTMIKKLVKPEIIEQHIEGDALSIYQDGDKRKTIALNSHPELAAGINAIRWALSGNLSALNNDFAIKYSENGDQWSMSLVPTEPEAAKKIKNILMVGKYNLITRIHIEQVNGDSVTTVLYEHH